MDFAQRRAVTERFLLYKYGNTSAASIPLALDEDVRSGRVKKGDVIACTGFGAGLSWGAAILRLSPWAPRKDTGVD